MGEVYDHVTRRCAECDARLWSEDAKQKGLCPECQDEDVNEATDLEGRLEDAFSRNDEDVTQGKD